MYLNSTAAHPRFEEWQGIAVHQQKAPQNIYLHCKLSLMPSAHGPIFCCRQIIGVKIGSCALTFAPI